VLLQHAHPDVPENLLLVHRPQLPDDSTAGADGLQSHSKGVAATGVRSSSSSTAAAVAAAAAGDAVLPFVPNRWAQSKSQHVHLHVARHKQRERQQPAASASGSGQLGQPAAAGSGVRQGMM
jgi:hypothetical protein